MIFKPFTLIHFTIFLSRLFPYLFEDILHPLGELYLLLIEGKGILMNVCGEGA